MAVPVEETNAAVHEGSAMSLRPSAGSQLAVERRSAFLRVLLRLLLASEE